LTGSTRAELSEFRSEEASRLLAQLDPSDPRQWRAWVAFNLLMNQGARATACLHLRWSDIIEHEGLIHWPHEFDKTRRAWRQPIRQATLKSFEVARYWREKLGFSGD